MPIKCQLITNWTFKKQKKVEIIDKPPTTVQRKIPSLISNIIHYLHSDFPKPRDFQPKSHTRSESIKQFSWKLGNGRGIRSYPYYFLLSIFYSISCPSSETIFSTQGFFPFFFINHEKPITGDR
jgi:hypothetical protein